MVNKCAVVGCYNGYKNRTEENTSFHQFPMTNDELLNKWMSAVDREDFIPTKHSRICSKHFEAHDFVEHSIDSIIVPEELHAY